MTYRTARIAFGILLLQVPRVYGQTEAPRPQFDVASIKLNPDCGNRAGRGERFRKVGRVPASRPFVYGVSPSSSV